MRVVGTVSREEFEPDPKRAFERGLAIDRDLALPGFDQQRGPKGAFRRTHAEMNAQDDANRLARAAWLQARMRKPDQ